MKRMGVLGGMGPQATMDFEVRVHAICQRCIPQNWNGGYPPMLVAYHRHLPIRFTDDGRPVTPMQADPRLLETAAYLGQWADFLVIPCNSAHIALQAIEAATGRPTLNMIDVTLAEVTRHAYATVGVLGFNGAPPMYLEPLRERGIVCEVIDATTQASLDAAIRSVMEGRDGADERDVARTAITTSRARAVQAVILGCTEIPLLLGAEGDAPDLINPTALLAETAVRYALGED